MSFVCPSYVAMFRESGWPLVLGAVTGFVAGCDDTVETACEPLVPRVVVVSEDGPGVWERGGLEPTLIELWRRGGTNPGEELAFPIFPSASPNGRLAIPDFQLGEVIVVEPDGTWRGAWARRGQGPGEIATPVAAVWGPDETLAVFDIVNAKVVYLREGEVAASDVSVDPTFTAPIVSSGELVWAGVQPGGATLLHPAWQPAESEEKDNQHVAVILRLEPGGAKPDTTSQSVFPTVSGERYSGWPVPGWPRPIAAVGAGGVLASGATDGSYRVLVSNEAGEPIHEICRQAGVTPLSAAERGDSVPDGLDQLAGALRDAPRPPSPSPFGRIVVGARGRVWVQRDRPPAFPGSGALLHGQPGALHDVFGVDGRYLGEVRMPTGAALQAAMGDTIWAFQTGEVDEVWVVAYALEFMTRSRVKPAG